MMKIICPTKKNAVAILLLVPAFCQGFLFTSDFRLSTTRLLSTVDTDTVPPSSKDLDELKSALVYVCSRSPKASLQEVQEAVQQVESLGEQIGIGQASSSSGLLSGEWELLYSPEDVTRSSPFFWAFRKAFPESADEIFGITDAIPAPIKEVGPAFQSIDFVPETGSGSFVSRVKVSTIGGLASSIMTTRGAITGTEGLDGLRLKIETTKPEDSTIIKAMFGPLGPVLNENAPAFPSGEALERAKPGSSEVILRTTYCDEGLRVSRNDDAFGDVYVWRRSEFSTSSFL